MTNLSAIDSTIFVSFLALTLYVGVVYSRGVNSMRDYAIGKRDFSDGVLLSTLAATWISGSGFFIFLSKTYSDGLYYLIPVLGMSMTMFVSAIFIVPRMGRFLGNTSIAGVMGSVYGTEVKIVVAITGMIGSAGLIGMQFRALGNIVHYFFNVDIVVGTIISGLVVIFYASYGGIRAVTFTDVLQFCTFGLVIPFVSISIWEQAYSIEGFSIKGVLASPKFNFNEVFKVGNPRLIEAISLFLYFLIPANRPSIYQRMLMGRSVKQIVKVFWICGFVTLFMSIAQAWIPFLIYGINPDLAQNELLGYIIDNYAYTGLKGLAVVGVTAMAMSTADSDINASSVLFASDIAPHFSERFKTHALYVSKCFSLVIGIVAIFAATRYEDLLQIALSAASFYIPVSCVPILLTILGFRTSKRSIICGMIFGFSFVIVWITFLKQMIYDRFNVTFDPVTVGMVINLTAIMIHHYIFGGKSSSSSNSDSEYGNKSSDVSDDKSSAKSFSDSSYSNLLGNRNDIKH